MEGKTQKPCSSLIWWPGECVFNESIVNVKRLFCNLLLSSCLQHFPRRRRKMFVPSQIFVLFQYWIGSDLLSFVAFAVDYEFLNSTIVYFYAALSVSKDWKPFQSCFFEMWRVWNSSIATKENQDDTLELIEQAPMSSVVCSILSLNHLDTNWMGIGVLEVLISFQSTLHCFTFQKLKIKYSKLKHY